MSTNGPVLQLILEKLNGMDKRLVNIETDVGVLKTDVGVLKTDVNNLQDRMGSVEAYIKKESNIQEETDVQQFIRASERHTITPASVFPLKTFYNENSTLLTDIDGCVVVGDEAYIIESKHALKQDEIPYKLRQFCKIQTILDDIRNDRIKLVQNTNFNTMVQNLKYLPQNLYFIFASDSMDEKMRKYIMKYNTGKIPEEELLFHVFKKSSIYSEIDKSSTVQKWVKIKLENAKSYNKILEIVNTDAAGLGVFKNKILEQFDTKNPCLPTLVGKLGILHLGEVTWPWFNKEETLLNVNVNGYTRSGGKRKTKRSKRLR